jgi:UDP-2,3-diacylglucosamine pyrophosphatase LpxH
MAVARSTLSLTVDADLLVISDLHLGEGCRPRTLTYSRSEDFFFEDALARFLDWHQKNRGPCGRWHLLVNGDLVDFLEVVDVSKTGAGEGSEHGLPCGARESALKLRQVAAGHPRVFEALAAFVAAGNLLTILKGNHDPEFHFGEVRAALKAILAEALARVPAPAGTSTDPSVFEDRVRFLDWFHHEPGVLWIEHGNQYDHWNCFEHWLSPLLPERPGWPAERKDEIDLPLGSLFVRYFLNRVEYTEPLADNVKPMQRFVLWFVWHRPGAALRFLWRDGYTFASRLRRACAKTGDHRGRWEEHRRRLDALTADWPVGKAAELESLLERSVLRDLGGVLPRTFRFLASSGLLLPVFWSVALVLALSATLVAGRVIDVAFLDGLQLLPASVAAYLHALATAGAVLLVLLGVAAGVWRLVRRKVPYSPSRLRAKAQGIADRLGVRYVVMGHTHDPGRWPLDAPRGAPRRAYYNTGCWNKVLAEDERLLRPDVQLVFLQGMRGKGGLRLQLMEWIEAIGEPRLLKLFDDEARRA